MAAARVLRAGKAAPAKITAQTFKRILSSWKWYAFVLGYVVREPLSSLAEVKLRVHV
jgi:ACS family pantothenate transporter-like MFS transporter